MGTMAGRWRPGEGRLAGRLARHFEHRHGHRHRGCPAPSSSGRVYRERRHAGHMDHLRDR